MKAIITKVRSAGALALVCMIVAGVVATTSSTSRADDAKLTVPSILGKTAEQAVKIVKAAGFSLEPEAYPLACDHATKVDGLIMCQSPDPGDKATKYTMIHFEVFVDRDKDHLTREKLAALKGLTLDAAKAKLKQIGHTGPIRIEYLSRYADACGKDTVCDVQPESGASFTDEVMLYFNPKPKAITVPDP